MKQPPIPDVLFSGKLKQKEIAPYRAKKLSSQNGICALCFTKIKTGSDTLDHDHTTGYVRAVLHADCNILLGKIENFLNRRGKALRDGEQGKRLPAFFINVYSYMVDNYSYNPLHPKHLTPEEKEIKLYKKRMKKAKRETTKKKYRDLIKLLQESLDERS